MRHSRAVSRSAHRRPRRHAGRARRDRRAAASRARDAQCYYRKPEATAAAFHGEWFRTGDLFRQDERGYYYIVGRVKEMIRRAGENISAREIEAVLRAMPEIVEAAAVPVPDATRGEEVKVFVVLRPGLPARTYRRRTSWRTASRASRGSSCRVMSRTSTACRRRRPRRSPSRCSRARRTRRLRRTTASKRAGFDQRVHFAGSGSTGAAPCAAWRSARCSTGGGFER